MEVLQTELGSADIKLNKSPPPIEIEKTGANNVQVFFLTKDSKEQIELTDKIKRVVSNAGIQNCIVKVRGPITIDDVFETLNPSVVYKKAIIIGTKGDLPGTEKRFKKLKNKYSDEFPIILPTSVKKGKFPRDFGEEILDFLGKIRIFTMDSGKISEKPLIVDEQATVEDVALKIHRSFVEKFDFATIIREGARQRRKRVGLDYKVKDGDAIELHTV
jgi:ribosome-interacting GTPase 1